MLVQVPPYLVRRLKHHFHQLPRGPLAIFGCNGWLWIGRASKQPNQGTSSLGSLSGPEAVSSDESLENVTIERVEREEICRTAAAVRVLSQAGLAVDPESVVRVVRWSTEMKVDVAEMMSYDFVAAVIEKEVEHREEAESKPK